MRDFLPEVGILIEFGLKQLYNWLYINMLEN